MCVVGGVQPRAVQTGVADRAADEAHHLPAGQGGEPAQEEEGGQYSIIAHQHSYPLYPSEAGKLAHAHLWFWSILVC